MFPILEILSQEVMVFYVILLVFIICSILLLDPQMDRDLFILDFFSFVFMWLTVPFLIFTNEMGCYSEDITSTQMGGSLLVIGSILVIVFGIISHQKRCISLSPPLIHVKKGSLAETRLRFRNLEQVEYNSTEKNEMRKDTFDLFKLKIDENNQIFL